MRKLSLIIAVFLLSLTSIFAQDENSDPNFTEYQDKVPGTLLFEFGFATLQDGSPENMDLNLVRSRTANIYYMYDFRLFGSKYISFNPGFGFGFDNYSFDKEMTTFKAAGQSHIYVVNGEDFIEGQSGENGVGVTKSKINVNYFDIPIEFRFRTKPSKKSFRLAVGGKVGVLIDAKTKVNYELGSDNYKFKLKSTYGYQDFRYGLHARLGFGSLNLFAYYALSDLFEKELRNVNDKVLEGNLRNIIIGLTVVTF